MALFPHGLLDPRFEHDSCGFGLIANIKGQASHGLVQTALTSLTRMSHRGAVAADGKTGDGCGVLLQLPIHFMREVAAKENFELDHKFAVGQLFLSTDDKNAQRVKQLLTTFVEQRGLKVAGFRSVPINTNACGSQALSELPRIEQIFINLQDDLEKAVAERHLFVARRLTEIVIDKEQLNSHIVSLSSATIIYKGMVTPNHLADFYQDLNHPLMQSALAVYHQRFSTNTNPRWHLAQPFKLLAHNGEINTIQGNRNWAKARGAKLSSALLPEMKELLPLVSDSDSDSMSLDKVLEGLLAGGMSLFRAMRILIPPAWQNYDTMDPDLKAFYEYHRMHMEPWDGPAGIVLSDGRFAACILDRNGLRPARWVLTTDNHLTLASEIGVYDYDNADVVKKGRLKPGEMFAVDTKARSGEKQILQSSDIDKVISTARPYRKWLRNQKHRLKSNLLTDTLTDNPLPNDELQIYQKLFLISREQREHIIQVLAVNGQEAIGSMGDDTPFPVLSDRIRSLYDNFRQQFAQVTNPPIDPLREHIVMSLETSFAKESNPFKQDEKHVSRWVANSPVLSGQKFKTLLSIDDSAFNHLFIDLNYPLSTTINDALSDICERARKAVRNGIPILVLSDRNIRAEYAPVHALLATGSVHHHLIDNGLRCDANIVVETGTAFDPHHFAVLLGYGATAIYPYLSYEIVQDLNHKGFIKDLSANQAGIQYRLGIEKGLYKITSKMGISTLTSYRGAQLFEIVGLHDEVVDKCFKGSVSRIRGLRFKDLDLDRRTLAWKAWNKHQKIEQGGLLKYVHGQEYHAYNPDVVHALQQAVSDDSYTQFKKFTELVNQRPICTLRDLMAVKMPSKNHARETPEIESEQQILARFDSAGMSLGALSPEAHESLAIAMNELGGRSNSGEGGEDPARYGTARMSKIKQIASGRFGVTPHYLVNADVLQIKIAQGAKPGEGGQLPGHKVNDLIARLRYSKPGVALISPPPHHDIYSIEDLAQLIYDLKEVNPSALVSVKLVSQAGVGTIAVGVAKAHADLITIAGYDGGTGASPLTSVKYAGSPWELGLVETHQALLSNELRDKVRLQVDGGLKTGLDVIKAAILGAESFGFGTAPMIAMGCKYLRICHLNNCATGVATQNQFLRLKHFKPQAAEKVVRYFRFLARDVKEHLAQLGVHQLTDLIGRVDLLQQIEGTNEKHRQVDLAPLLVPAKTKPNTAVYCVQTRNKRLHRSELAKQMLIDCKTSIAEDKGGQSSYKVCNFDRAIGANLSGEIARRHGLNGLTNDLNLRFHGTAGQSFGAWNAAGLKMHLEGDANDYVGKGMAGGEIVISPPLNSRYLSHENVIMGNTCLYGATGGHLYAAGLAGERFAVRNSGAIAIVEGSGDHCCEYMTGGVVVVLGQTGVNFGAGMTGGFAFVYDHERNFFDRYNHELIDLHRINTESMEAHADYLHNLIEQHISRTQSLWAQTILRDFDELLPNFWMIKPKATELNSLLEKLREAA